MILSLSNNKRVLISLGLFLIVVFLLLWWLFPRVLYFIYFNRGASHLNNVLMSLDQEKEFPSICGLSTTITGIKFQDLKNAQINLEKAIQVMPNFSRSYLVMGRILCLLGESHEATKKLEIYTSKNPKDPIGHIEKALAEYVLMQSNCVGQEVNIDCYSGDFNQSIINEWKLAHIDINNFRDFAAISFDKQHFSEASLYYMYYASANKLTTSEKFRWIIANIISKHSYPQRIDSTIAPIHSIINGFLHIDAKDLQWIIENPDKSPYYGQSLKDYPGSDPDSGVIYWNGSVAGVIYVPVDGEFLLTIKAQNSKPSPIKMDLEVNSLPVFHIITTKDDLSWESYSTPVNLKKGYHIIGVRFMNNYENNIDRDAVVKWIELMQTK